MCVNLSPKDLNSDSYSFTSQELCTCRITIAPRMRGGVIQDWKGLVVTCMNKKVKVVRNAEKLRSYCIVTVQAPICNGGGKSRYNIG